MGPSSITSAPAADNPASSADSNIYPEIRVSLPTRMRHAPMLRNAMPAAQPSLSMKSGVIGNSPTRPRIPSVPKYFFVISAPSFLFGRFYCGKHADDIHGLSDIVHAQDARTLGHSKCRKRQPTIKPLAQRTIQRLTYHALARNADQQRPTQGMQGFHMFEQT